MLTNRGHVHLKRGLLPLLALTFSSLLAEGARLRNKIDRNPGVPHVKKSSCSGRKCKLDLSLIDNNATEIAVPVGLSETRLKTFKTTGKSKKKGHWNGEVDFSYLNLLKQGTGPNGTHLWFGSMYDGEEDVYYDISPDANGTSIVATARRGSELPMSMGVEVPINSNSTNNVTDTSSITDHISRRQLAENGSFIDIMYVWTMGAECKASGLNSNCTVTAQTEINMRGKINTIISDTNVIYSQSGILTQLRLVYAYRHPTYKWDYQNNCYDALSHLSTANDGQLDDVLILRSQYRADAVQMIHVPCSYCGRGFVNPVPNKNFMFSVVSTDCLVYTPAHEIGHNQGCRHDRAADNYCSDSGYNFGYRDPTQGFRDVMAYDCLNNCKCSYNCGTKSCARVARISNTKILYNGFPIGTAQNNCAQTINDNRVAIANFYAS